MIVEILEKTPAPRISSGKFSISGINGCWRKKYLEMKGLHKEDYNSKTLRNFDIGDLCHKQVVKELLEKTPNSNLSIVSAEVNIPIQKYISGRVDIILSNKETGELYVVDCKSAGDWTLNKIKEEEVPFNYICQVQLYLHFLNLKKGYLLFFGKHKGEILEKEVIYDKELCEKLVAQIEDFMINNVEKSIEPARCENKDGWLRCLACYPITDNQNLKGGLN
jgi:predicted phage-related endonuclease